jgi:uncharacterized protein
VTEHVLTLKQFFEEARAGRLTGIRCGKCGELAIPPKQFCAGCQDRNWTPVPLAGKGVITSFTVIRIAPRGRAGEAPYAVAVVKLDEGVSLLGRIVDIPLDTLRAGLPVQFRALATGEQTAVGFGPA